ncbi:hypothetical protein KQH27_00905 [bacterium]|nr:hypothetical protein [bacterium]
MVASNCIPSALKKLSQWVVWIEVKKEDGRRTKVPIDPKMNGINYAKSNDLATWGTYEDAIRHMATYGGDGVGFVVTKNDDIVGVDLDDCVDIKTGRIEEAALEDIKSINSYTEISPSGEGIRIFARGSLPVAGRKTAKCEIYCDKHFLTVTGNHVSNTPLKIEKRQAEINNIFSKYFSAANQKPKIGVNQKITCESDDFESHQSTSQANPYATLLNTEDILNQALRAKNGPKFKRLWEGDTSEYSSHSEADLAFCGILAFWTGKDPVSIDRIYRKSKLYRSKWDEKRGNRTYGQKTIEQAIRSAMDIYQPSSNPLAVSNLLKEIELFHDDDKAPWVTFPCDNHFETWSVYSDPFIFWLEKKSYKLIGKTPKEKDLDAVIDQLSNIARFESPQKELHIRIGYHEGKIYVDLADEKWRVIKITKKGWKLIGAKKCPIKFKRTHGMLALPSPKKGGGLSKLKKILRFPDEDSFRLTIGWLLGVLHPTGPYPILFINGEPGSSKSSFALQLKKLIDPSKANTRNCPKSEQDLVLSAIHSRVLAFDNISFVKGWLSDALCRMATGSGYATRKLYEDDEEKIYEACRPIILNGVEPYISGHDLIDRCISIELLPIDEKDREEKATLNRKFKKFHPKMLGALFNAVSMALKNRSNTKVKGLPRMADFAKWVVASEPALPWKAGKFLKSYKTNIDQSAQKSLSSDVVATAVIDLIQEERKWKGTPTELLRDLESYVHHKTLQSRAWPKAASTLSKKLKMAKPFLKLQGIKITFDRTTKKRVIKIRKLGRKK